MSESATSAHTPQTIRFIPRALIGVNAVNGTEEDSPIPQNITVPVGGATNWTWYPS